MVFYVHGFSDYAGRFAHLAQMFSRAGFDFYSMDVRGHGQSDGRTVLVPSIETIADDTHRFHKMVHELYAQHSLQTKYFVVAHSLGCMQLLNLLMRK